MLQKVREWLVPVLIVFLPFHAFLVTVGTRLFAGQGHAPLPWLAMWKEAVLALVMAIAAIEVLREKIQNPKSKIQISKLFDVVDMLILGMFVLGVVVSVFNSPTFALRASAGRQLSVIHFIYGFKYTPFPLLLFLLLRRVSWSDRFLLLTPYSLLLVGVGVAVYGMFTLLLPQHFFTWLGYSDLHSTYLPDGPLAAFQYLEGSGIRRMQSTFAGPNQLGMWLLIPWSVVLGGLLHFPSPSGGGLGRGGREFPNNVPRQWSIVPLLLLFTLSLFLTFSRAAWIGAVVILLVALRNHFSRRTRCWLLVAGCSFLAVLFVISAVTRPQSTADHFRRPLEALRIIAQNPLGLGLGTAGPAANRTGDPCMYFAEGTDVSWAADRPSLCVFVGDRQVQPFDFAQGKPVPCRCPLLPENWYLQVGVELGVLGLMLHLALVGVVGYWLLVIDRNQLSIIPPSFSELRRAGNYQLSIFLAFVGISVAALFLHAWEDSAVAYTVWILLAAVLSPTTRRVFPKSSFSG